VDHGCKDKGKLVPAKIQCVAVLDDLDVLNVHAREELPDHVEGLLVAGRCLSATSDAAGAIRVMPPVMAMGQAAGAAAALAVKNSVTPREVDVPALLDVLRKQNVFLG
jgi:hypothetical protein